MRKILYFSLITLICISCNNAKQKPDESTAEEISVVEEIPVIEESSTIKTFPVNSSIRAIQAVDEKTCWFAGSGGKYGFTEDAGESWVIDSIEVDGVQLEFRSIVLTSKVVFLLSVASPAMMFKSADKGKNWKMVYREDHPECFYNSMAFWDDQNGIAVGDPVNGCLSVIITNNGGEIWEQLTCNFLPGTYSGEAGFAASNTNVVVLNDNAWIVSGGAKARVFHSPDKGKTWKVFDTPIKQGGKMTGIFSAAFYDDKTGIIIGGDWENQDSKEKCIALSNDGGQSWQLIDKTNSTGYRSCVQYIPGTNGKELIAVGIPGISFSDDGGESWKDYSKESFYTIRIPNSQNIAWLGGKNKMGRIEW